MFFIGYLAQIPANMACVALGPRRWLPMLLVAWGAVAMCFAAVGSMASFLALRLLLGVAEAGAVSEASCCEAGGSVPSRTLVLWLAASPGKPALPHHS